MFCYHFHMPIFQSLVLGIVQGLSEFLPISSSAHLILVPWFFKWNDPGLGFDVALHWGTLIALIFYFRRDVVQMIVGGLGALTGKRNAENKLPWMVVAATIPAALAGLKLEHLAETSLRSPLLIVGTLSSIALVMGWADRHGDQGSTLDSLTFAKAILIGVAQCLALVPGVSRSGITIIMGLLLGLDRQSAVRFSFLLSIPIIAGAGLLKIGEVIQHAHEISFWMGVSASAISGLAAIHFLITFVRTKKLTPFVIYRLGLAAIVLAVVLARR